MNLAKRTLIAAIFGCLCLSAFSQNIVITYTKSDSLFVCGTDTFSIKVQNNNPALLSGALLTVALPPGLTYVVASVSGASQQNISNLSAPVFSLPDIPNGQSGLVKILLRADCAAADVLDAGQLFIANLTLTSSLGNAQVSTTSIPVETGAVVIESVTEQLLVGERFDTLKRTICVKNTRLGKIGNLHFEDAHLAGFSVSIAEADSQLDNGNFFSAEFGGNLFSGTGNGDTWLDLNETVCFTEEIIITSCGIPPFTNPSTLRVGWGCGGEVCRYDSAVAFIEIKTSTKVPNLVFEQIWNPPTDYCGTVPAVMGYKIKNIGPVEAKDIIFNLTLVEGLAEAGMASNSFRIISSSGTNAISPNLTTPTILNACGVLAEREASFLIPLVGAKDSLLFLFDVLTCTESCDQVQPSFRADYFYKKDCPPNGFVSGFALINPPDGYTVEADLLASIGLCLESGQSYPLFYKAISRYLTEDGFWHLKLELPLGITLDEACGVLLGNTPPVLHETTPNAGGGQVVHLAWATPLPADSLNMDFCLHYECDTNIVCIDPPISPSGGVIYTDLCCFVQLRDISYWSAELGTAASCGISVCDEKLLAINLACKPGEVPPPGDTTSIDPIIPIPGLRDWWNVYRLNLGHLDADDDRKAELPLQPASTQARRDRFLAGDTLRVEYCGVMDSNVIIDTIGRAIWHEVVGSDMLLNNNDGFLTVSAQNGFADNSKFRFIGNTIRVRYADGTEASCQTSIKLYADDENYFQIVNPNSYPLTPIDDIATHKFYFIISLPQLFDNGCLPKPEIGLGDSIFIYSDFKLDLNFKPTSSNNPNPPLVGFRTATSGGGLLYAWNAQPHQMLQYSGWRKTQSPNTHSIKPCENSLEVKKFRYSMRIARENMFPFEVRPLAWISDYRQTVPAGLELNAAKVEYLTLQDSVPFLSNLNLPFSQIPGILDIDFAPAFSQPIDEGFTLRSNLIFKPTCQFTLPDTSKQYIETSFMNCLNGAQMTILDSIKNSIGFFSNTPSLSLLSGDTVVYAPTHSFEIDFDIKNALVSPAPAVWVSVVSASGLVSELELFQMPQNQPLSGTNNFFNLGPVGGVSQRSFRLRGKNIACETDSLLLVFGWGCAPMASLEETACGRDTLLVELHLERPELELDILQEPSSITLCDTSDWFEYEIFNAKIGYAYNLEAAVKLPPGLRIVPGTCQISYPEGSPWVNITDPALLPGNLYQWQVNQIQAILASNGLPGVNLNPQNSFHIRFKTIAECGFVANTPLIYGATGLEPCGRQANALNKPGEPLHVIGLDPGYGVDVSIADAGSSAGTCGGEQEFSVQLVLQGTPSPGDSVYILLPAGLSFVPGSYNPGTNAPTGPPTANLQGFQLPLPTLPAGSVVQFKFKVKLSQLAGCDDQLILVQTRVRTEAFCETIGTDCAVYISTGEAVWNLEVSHPQLSIVNANLFISNGAANGTFTVNNLGNVDAQATTLQLWRDLNANGIPDAGDLLLQTLQSSEFLAAGSSIQITGTLGIDSSDLCGLLAVLPGAENCACDDVVWPIEQISLTHTPIVLCEAQPITLGVMSQMGFSYEWQPSGQLQCANCSLTVFSPDPNTLPGTPITLTLAETSPGCSITHVFDITIGAIAQIQADQATICAGENVTLHASPTNAASYHWEGTGIQNPGLPSQTIQPNTSGNYAITITFSNGCTAADSLFVEVLEADTLQLPELTTCEGEPVEIFGNMIVTPGIYQLVLPKSNGCDSTIMQSLTVLPKPSTEEARVFCLGDSILVFDTLVAQSGEICRTFSSFNGCDSTHCISVTAQQIPIFTSSDTIFSTYGQIITLIGPDGFVTYVWEPAPVPPCVNCPTVTYPADSVGYHEYLLRVSDSLGCSGELLFRVVVFPPCSPDSLFIPNAFTPNGDGANDVFRVVAHEGAEQVTGLEIYDRWGEKVYENRGDAFWDGTIDGKPAPSDVYVYIVKVECGELIGKRVGDVTLLR